MVPAVVDQVMRGNDRRRPSPLSVFRTWLTSLLLLITSVFSIASFVLTQKYNHCQTNATQRLREASNSDRAAQDLLDEKLLAPGKRVTTRAAADEAYQNFKSIRAANEAKRARTNGNC